MTNIDLIKMTWIASCYSTDWYVIVKIFINELFHVNDYDQQIIIY